MLDVVASVTYVVFLFGSHCVNEVLLGHERLSILIFLCMAEEIGSGLVRQLGLFGAAHQSLLDGLLDATHCGVKPNK